MTRETHIRHVLEWLHPVLLIQAVCPLMYAFYKERVDGYILPLYLIAFLLVICSFASRAAARRVKTMGLYLGICLASAAAALGMAWVLGGRYLSVYLRIALMVEMVIGCVWLVWDAGSIRMRDKRKKKAHEENDISWTDTEVILERPLRVGIAWFAIVYLAGLLNFCPILCDLALGFGTAYLLLVLVYWQLDATESFLEGRSGISNVPKKKIRTMRMGMLLVMMAGFLLTVLPALLSGRGRIYRDLRFQEFTAPVMMDMPMELSEEMQGEAVDWSEFLSEEEFYREPPWWLHYVEEAVGALFAVALAGVVLKGIVGYFRDFRGAPEENGDIAQALDEDVAVKLAGQKRRNPFAPLTDREKIRRAYRRAIRKYRKDSPSSYETPSEIEANADFPEGFDENKLHVEYEQARYAK